MRRRVALPLVFLTIAVVCGVAVELAARLIVKRREPEPVVPRVIGRRDSLLGWSLTPGAEGVSRRTGAPVEYRINSLGLRGRETTYQKPDGTFRIVVVGDSRTFGWGVPIDQHFTTLLEGYFRKVEVINLGVSGYGIDQELLRLRQEGFRFEPDLVLAYVAHYGGNRHMHTVRWGAVKPRFVLQHDSLVLMNSPVRRPAAGPNRSVNPGWLARNLEVVRILSAPGRSTQSDEEAQEIADSVDLANPSFHAQLYQLGEALVFAMHNEASAHGASFVLVTHIDTLYRASISRNVLVLNVRDALHNRLLELPAPLGHLNEAGNGVLAWAISEYLMAHQLVPRNHLNRKLLTQ